MEEAVPTARAAAEEAVPSAAAPTGVGEKRAREAEEAAPASGLDAWAEETPASAVTTGAEGRDGGGASTSGAPAVSAPAASPGGRRKRPKRKCFRYGNYHRYYGYRVGESLEDHRIPHFRREWFEGKRCVDIGCNEGLVSLSIAVQFRPASMLGIDIDPVLVNKAQEKLERLRRSAAREAARLEAESAAEATEREDTPAAPPATTTTTAAGDDAPPPPHSHSPPENENAAANSNAPPPTAPSDPSSALADAGPALGGVSFRRANFLDERFEPGSVDAVLCLSVTKWIQLNWGDAGLRRMFEEVHRALAPGGVFIVEPQPWKSYKQAFKKQPMPEETRAHFRAIALRPTLYAEHLRRAVGFSSVSTLRDADLHTADDFDRTVLLCVK